VWDSFPGGEIRPASNSSVDDFGDDLCFARLDDGKSHSASSPWPFVLVSVDLGHDLEEIILGTTDCSGDHHDVLGERTHFLQRGIVTTHLQSCRSNLCSTLAKRTRELKTFMDAFSDSFGSGDDWFSDQSRSDASILGWHTTFDHRAATVDLTLATSRHVEFPRNHHGWFLVNRLWTFPNQQRTIPSRFSHHLVDTLGRRLCFTGIIDLVTP